MCIKIPVFAAEMNPIFIYSKEDLDRAISNRCTSSAIGQVQLQSVQDTSIRPEWVLFPDDTNSVYNFMVNNPDEFGRLELLCFINDELKQMREFGIKHSSYRPIKYGKFCTDTNEYGKYGITSIDFGVFYYSNMHHQICEALKKMRYLREVRGIYAQSPSDLMSILNQIAQSNQFVEKVEIFCNHNPRTDSPVIGDWEHTLFKLYDISDFRRVTIRGYEWNTSMKVYLNLKWTEFRAHKKIQVALNEDEIYPRLTVLKSRGTCLQSKLSQLPNLQKLTMKFSIGDAQKEEVTYPVGLTHLHLFNDCEEQRSSPAEEEVLDCITLPSTLEQLRLTGFITIKGLHHLQNLKFLHIERCDHSYQHRMRKTIVNMNGCCFPGMEKLMIDNLIFDNWNWRNLFPNLKTLIFTKGMGKEFPSTEVIQGIPLLENYVFLRPENRLSDKHKRMLPNLKLCTDQVTLQNKGVKVGISTKFAER